MLKVLLTEMINKLVGEILLKTKKKDLFLKKYLKHFFLQLFYPTILTMILLTIFYGCR